MKNLIFLMFIVTALSMPLSLRALAEDTPGTGEQADSQVDCTAVMDGDYVQLEASDDGDDTTGSQSGTEN